VASQYVGWPGLSAAGFSGRVDLSSVSPGEHRIAIRVKLEDGSTAVVGEQPIRVLGGPDAIGFIDLPAEGASVSGPTYVAGWALGMRSPVAQVEVSVDGKAVATATKGYRRPDVAAVHVSLPDADTSGWDAIVDTARLKPGPHVLGVACVLADGGHVTLGQKKIIISAPPPRLGK
jgi:hypothetical protein